MGFGTKGLHHGDTEKNFQKVRLRSVPFSFPNWRLVRNNSSLAAEYIQGPNTIDNAAGSFGGWCQWVLDDACHAFEWLQPLGFDSLAL